MSTPNSPLLVIAAGGTGGHMFPAQALAEVMLARGWRVTLSTDERGAGYAGSFPAEVSRQVVPSATFARGGKLAKLAVPFRIMAGTLKTIWRFRKDRPAVVVGFGGYPSIPALSAATVLRLPQMIHEQNAVLGRVNALFAKRADYLACGMWPTVLPKGAEGTYTGNPVRAAVKARAGAGYIAPGDYPMSLLAIGGSQGARILSTVLPEAMALLPENLRRQIRVAQQARAEDAEQVTNRYAELGVSAEVASFFEDIPKRLSEAQLVISRAGASSIADIGVIGRPSILVPLASAMDDHQSLNARGLAEAGAAILLPESRFDPATVAEHIAMILTQPEAANAMAQAAQSQGRPDAAEALAILVEALAV